MRVLNILSIFCYLNIFISSNGLNYISKQNFIFQGGYDVQIVENVLSHLNIRSSILCSSFCLNNKDCDGFKLNGSACLILESITKLIKVSYLSSLYLRLEDDPSNYQSTSSSQASTKEKTESTTSEESKETSSTTSSTALITTSSQTSTTLLTTTTTTDITSTTTSNPYATNGYVKYPHDERYVKINEVKSDLSREDALKQCQEAGEGATLFIIRTNDDASWLANSIYEDYKSGSLASTFWIGIKKSGNNASWSDDTDASDTCEKYASSINECKLPGSSIKYAWAEPYSQTQMNIVASKNTNSAEGYVCQIYP